MNVQTIFCEVCPKSEKRSQKAYRVKENEEKYALNQKKEVKKHTASKKMKKSMP